MKKLLLILLFISYSHISLAQDLQIMVDDDGTMAQSNNSNFSMWNDTGKMNFEKGKMGELKLNNNPIDISDDSLKSSKFKSQVDNKFNKNRRFNILSNSYSTQTQIVSFYLYRKYIRFNKNYNCASPITMAVFPIVVSEFLHPVVSIALSTLKALLKERGYARREIPDLIALTQNSSICNAFETTLAEINSFLKHKDSEIQGHALNTENKEKIKRYATLKIAYDNLYNYIFLYNLYVNLPIRSNNNQLVSNALDNFENIFPEFKGVTRASSELTNFLAIIDDMESLLKNYKTSIVENTNFNSTSNVIGSANKIKNFLNNPQSYYNGLAKTSLPQTLHLFNYTSSSSSSTPPSNLITSSNPSSVATFWSDLGSASFMIPRNNDPTAADNITYDGRTFHRFYFAQLSSRPGQSPGDYFLSHDNIGQLHLGSWDRRPRVLLINNDHSAGNTTFRIIEVDIGLTENNFASVIAPSIPSGFKIADWTDLENYFE